MSSYSEIIENLSWNKTIDIQKQAISILINAKDWNYAGCLKKTRKDIWQNMLKVIEKKTQGVQLELLDELLFLFQDLNWPGVDSAFNIITHLPRETIVPYIENALLNAYKQNDGMWIANLKKILEYFDFNHDTFRNIDFDTIISIADY